MLVRVEAAASEVEVLQAEDLAEVEEEAGDEQNIIHAYSDYRLKINMIFKYTMGKIYSTFFEDFLHYLRKLAFKLRVRPSDKNFQPLNLVF